MLLDSLYQKVTDLPAIVQGALGSGLFWLVLKTITFLWLRIARVFGATAAIVNRNQKIREYVYRRLTGMSGLVNYTQGYLYTFSRVLQHVLMGFIFVCIALMVGGTAPVVWGICLAGAIYYFLSGLIWLVPKDRWKADPPLEHWKRVAELEEELMGKVDAETKERIEQFQKQRQKESQRPATPVDV